MTSTPELPRPAYGLTNDLPSGHQLRGLLAALMVAAAVLASFPFARLAFGDEFTYMQTAWDFGRTGHLVYNGWGAPMLGWLALWGALFARCFGPGADVLRLSVLVLAAACIYLFHEILLRFAIDRKVALFASLALGLSPFYFPLAFSFMTDIPGLFVILLCIGMCQRAVTAKTDRSMVAWLVAAAGVNVVGGTVRQICWLGVLVMVPATAWVLRRQRHVIVTAVASWMCSAAAIFLCLHWLSHQMYNVPEHILPETYQLHNVGRVVSEYVKGILCLSLIVTPLAVAALANLSHFKRSAFLRLGVLLLLLSVIWIHPWKGDLDKTLMPWLEPVLASQGMVEPRNPLASAATLHFPERIFLSVLNVVLTWALLESITIWWKQTRAEQRERSAAFWILVPFSLAVILLILPRAYDSLIQDRYLLLLLPAVTVLLVFGLKQRDRLALPRVAYGMLLIFFLYGIAGLHDERAAARSIDHAAATLLAAGVPRTSIVEGFGPDELVQIAHTGHVNNPKMWPSSAYDPHLPPPYLPDGCTLLVPEEAPLVQPGFLIVARLEPCVTKTSFAPVPYRTWLPPYDRASYIAKPAKR